MSTSFGELRAKLASFLQKKQRDQDLEAEMASHLEMAVEENVQQGMSLEEARRKALVRFGGMERAKEEHRDARGLPAMESILQDLRYTFRTLRRDAGFTLFAVLIIGLGIGASSTVFSVLNTLLVRPLPFRDPGRLVWIANNGGDGNMSGQTVQVTRLLDLRELNKSFSDIAGYFAFYGVGDNKLTGQGEPERLSGVPVSQNFFPLLDVQPQLGRQFSAAECKWNGPKAVLLSHGLWERRFASDPGIVGKPLTLNDAAFTVVGVLPASFDFGSIFAPGAHIDLYFPFALSKETDRWGNTLALVGRLKPGVSLPTAQAEASVLGIHITSKYPRQNGLEPRLSFLRQHVSGRLRPALLVLACSVGAVMLIVCANLSNLLLARTATRQKEMAIRSALGAGRKRLIRQLLTESIVLTCAGAALGLLLAIGATKAITHLDAFNIPLLASVQVDPVALAFTLLVAMLTGIILGMAPALQVSAIPINAALAGGSRGASESKGHTWIRGALVISEIAFACVLLVGAGLLIRSFLRVLDVDLGFRPERAGTLRIDPGPQYKTQEEQNGYYDEALRRVRNLPGIDAAGLTDALPLGRNRSWGASAKGKTYKDGAYPSAFVRIVTDGYIKAMGMTLKAGRDLTPQDTKGKTSVIMVNETLARTLWPGQNPLGQIIPGECDGTDRQVVGVVGDVRHIALEQNSGSEMYIPIRQCMDSGSIDLVVRSRLPLAAVASQVQASLRPIEPTLPKGGFRPLQQLVDKAASPRRFIVFLLGGFAVFAVVLASLGIYGVISYSVNQKTKEIGIRMALGASTGEVQRRIVMQTLGLAAAGMLVGVAASSGLARALKGLLFGVTYEDPLTFLGTMGVLLSVALLAGYLPARRASRIDPTVALRAN
jgi:putative ABC transport system permease protein